jgi:hypothetical protein
MNTPTTEEIEAVLDPLLDRLIAAYGGLVCSISRQKWKSEQTKEWRATADGGNYTTSGNTPVEAVVNLLAMRPKQIAKRRAELEAALAALEPEPAEPQPPEHFDDVAQAYLERTKETPTP